MGNGGKSQELWRFMGILEINLVPAFFLTSPLSRRKDLYSFARRQQS
jgi:hypothetical protein